MGEQSGYLTNDKRVYYVKCLKKELALGKIDIGIEDHVIALSRCENICPIFSKKNMRPKKSCYDSYLWIGYTMEIESELRVIKSYFEQTYTQHNFYKCVCKEDPGYKRPNLPETSSNNGSCWNCDGEYFFIKFMSFTLNNGDFKLHELFWDDLVEKLMAID